MREDYVNPFIDVLKKAKALRERVSAEQKAETADRKRRELEEAKKALETQKKEPLQ